MHKLFLNIAQIIDLVLGVCYSKTVKNRPFYDIISDSDSAFSCIYRSILLHRFWNEQVSHSSAAGSGNQDP